MAKRLFLIWVGTLLMLTYSVAFGLEYPSGFTFMEVPDPLSGDNPTYPLISKSVPAIGESFFDLRFGTILTRVTQIETMNGGPVGRHEYSRFDPFNKDQPMILLLPEGDWRVFRTQLTPYNQDGNLVRTLNGMEEPRWDPSVPHLVWCHQQFRLVTVDILSGQITVIKDFASDSTIQPILSSEPDLYRITMMDEGESSQDKRYWAFSLQGSGEDYRLRYIFTWDRLQDRILGLYKIPLNESDIDWVGMSPLGNWVLIGGQPDNSGNLIGLTMANKELTQFHQLDYATAHSDVGLDIQGNEVIVMQNIQTDYIDLIPIDPNTKVVTNAGDYPGSNRTPLIRLYYNNQSPIGLNSGVHISCNVPGYCVVSTTTGPGLSEQNWLDRTITLVKLNRSNPRVFYLAKVYNTTGTYWEETHAAITNDGKKVVWAENWGQDVGQGNVFLMQLDMPSNWIGALPSTGLWSIDEGSPGDSGRGFQLELRNNVMVLTYYGYNADGKAQWYLAAGNFADGSFSGPMWRLEGGTYLGGPYRAASPIESVGTVSITFSSSTTGTIILPNEQPKGISKFLW